MHLTTAAEQLPIIETTYQVTRNAAYKSCQLANNFLTPSNKPNMNSPSLWSASADSYEEYLPQTTLPFSKHALEFTLETLLTQNPPLRILDVACGPGPLTQLAAERWPQETGTTIVATDFAGGMVKVLEKKAKNNGWSHVSARVMDATAMDIPSDSFDAAFCIFGLHLLPDGMKGLKEMYRVLRSGGVASVAIPVNMQHGPMAMEAIRRMVPGKEFHPSAPNPAAINWFQLSSVEQAFHSLGFTDMRSITHSSPFKLPSSKLHNFFGSLANNPGVVSGILAAGLENVEAVRNQWVEQVVQVIKERMGEGKDGYYEFEAGSIVVVGRK